MLGTGVYSRAQHYFNVRDALHSTTSIITSVVEVNNKYYCTGPCVDSINRQPDGSWLVRSGIKFAVFDATGTKLIDTVYQSNYKNIDPWSNNLYHIGGTQFILAAEGVDTGSKAKMLLFKFDSTGKVFWEAEYDKPTCTERVFYRLNDFKYDSLRHCWLMLSTSSCTRPGGGVHADIILTKLDTSFNVVWHQRYGDAQLNDIPTKVIIEPDGYAIGGGLDNGNLVSKNYSFRAQIIKTDTAGTVQWTYLSPISRLTKWMQDLVKTQDGGYVYCGQGDGVERVFPNGVNADVLWKGWVEKLDVNRNSVWTKVIGNLTSSTISNEQRILKQLPDDAIIIGGMIAGGFSPNDTLPFNYGSIVKVDDNGATIWERKYAITSDTFLYNVYDIDATADGGYVISGEARDVFFPYNDPSQRGWLVKVDSNGCMSATDPQCDPLNIPDLPHAMEFPVFPNPTTEILYINSKNPKPSTIVVCDLVGRVVTDQSLHLGINRLELHNAPSGVYVYKIVDTAGMIQRGKFVKE